MTADGAFDVPDVLVMGAGAQWDPDAEEKLAEFARRGARDGATPAEPAADVATDSAAYHHLEAFIKYLQLAGDRP